MVLSRFKYFCILSMYILLTGCAGSVLKPIAPEVEITNVTLSAVNFPMSEILFSIVVINPNNFDINVEYIDIQFHVMDNLISSEYWSNIDLLRAQQKQQMDIPVKVDLLNAFTLLPQLMSENKVLYKISGTLKLENYSKEMPFTYNGDFKSSQINNMTRNDRLAHPVNRLYRF